MSKVMLVLEDSMDCDILEGIIDELRFFNIEYIFHICSPHLSPFKISDIVKEAEESGYDIILAIDDTKHLSGALAAETLIPVISMSDSGNRIKFTEGVPIAFFGGGARNAVVYTAQILAIHDKSLLEKLRLFRAEMETKIEKDEKNILGKL